MTHKPFVIFYTNNGKNNLARERKIKKPKTSVAVVRKILEATAGSAPSFFNRTGTVKPKMPPTIKLPIIAIKTITAK